MSRDWTQQEFGITDDTPTNTVVSEKWNEMGVYDENEELEIDSTKELKKQYDIITGISKREFVEKISEKLEEGWNLQGGVAYADGYFMQAIYREITYLEYYKELEK